MEAMRAPKKEGDDWRRCLPTAALLPVAVYGTRHIPSEGQLEAKHIPIARVCEGRNRLRIAAQKKRRGIGPTACSSLSSGYQTTS
jgi:hypothetical protein